MTTLRTSASLSIESSLMIDVSEKLLTFSSPWLDMELEIEANPFVKSIDALQGLADGRRIHSDQLSEELQDLLWLPFFTFDPISAHCKLFKKTKEQFDFDLNEFNISDFNKIIIEFLPDLKIVSSDLKIPSHYDSMAKDVVNKSWDDATGNCDPNLAFLEIRYQALKIEACHDPKTMTVNGLKFLAETNPHGYHEAAAELLRSAYLATTLCRPLILPALQKFPKQSRLLEEFLEDENGHDKLMQQSLRALGENAESPMGVREEAVVTMGTLARAATKNPFALACVISAFEGYTAQDDDELAKSLHTQGLHSVALGLDRHLAINLAGEHHDFGKNLLNTLDHLTPEDVFSAALLTFIKTYSECKLAEAILKNQGFRGGENVLLR